MLVDVKRMTDHSLATTERSSVGSIDEASLSLDQKVTSVGTLGHYSQQAMKTTLSARCKPSIIYRCPHTGSTIPLRMARGDTRLKVTLHVPVPFSSRLPLTKSDRGTTLLAGSQLRGLCAVLRSCWPHHSYCANARRARGTTIRTLTRWAG
jgi:hypothetical protein